MIRIIIIVVFLLNGMHLNSQQTLSIDQKSEKIKTVFNNLYDAMGLIENKPQIILDSKRTSSVAYLKRNKDGSKTLAIEEKAFDICMQFNEKSDAALALLLGHELGHFKFNHHWGKDFSSSFALSDIENNIQEATEKLNELKYFETQADQTGGIICYLAGYKITGLAKELFPLLYKAYSLPETSQRYPSLNERVQISLQNDSIVGNLVKVFEIANYTLITGEYNESSNCFEFILNKGFRSREVYNSLGLSKFLHALKLIGIDKVKYLYPVELDVESRISTNFKGFSNEINQLLNEAKENFDFTVKLDKNYLAGYINLACVEAVLNQFSDAAFHATKAFELAKELNLIESFSNIDVLYGIIDALNGNKSSAEEKFKSAIKRDGSFLAEANLQIMNGKSPQNIKWIKKHLKSTEKSDSISSKISKPENIENVSDFTKDLTGLALDEIELGNDSYCYYANYKNSTILNFTNTNQREFYFQKTGKNYIGNSAKNLRVGDKEENMILSYGIPDIRINSGKYVYCYYYNSRIIFILQDKLIDSWVVYYDYQH